MTVAVGEPASRRVPPSMVIIGALLYTAFVIVVTVMVVTVRNGDTLAPPEIADLSLPSGITLVESHLICRAEGCYGQGAVVHWDPILAPAAVGMLARRLEDDGWEDLALCPEHARCLVREDLRVVIQPWGTVDPLVGAVMRTSIRERGLDESEFVYLKVERPPE